MPSASIASSSTASLGATVDAVLSASRSISAKASSIVGCSLDQHGLAGLVAAPCPRVPTEDRFRPQRAGVSSNDGWLGGAASRF